MPWGQEGRPWGREARRAVKTRLNREGVEAPVLYQELECIHGRAGAVRYNPGLSVL